MLNTDYNQKFGKEGLTFDDVLLIAAGSERHRGANRQGDTQDASE